MAQKVGMVVIGQTPRTEIMQVMREMLGDTVEVVEKGALDGLCLEEIKALRPEEGMTIIATRLADGTQVTLGEEKIIPKVQDKIYALNEEGVDLIVLSCTGHFPRFKSRCLIIEAQKVVDHCLAALMREGDRLGVLVPLPEQMTLARQSLSYITKNVAVTSASPFGPVEEVARAAETLKEEQVDLVVMHCMGFTNEHRRVWRRFCPAPVVIANSMVARITAELLQS
ncbi:MAG: AroM family protein [Deltaproteobacteria bacterium]|nr:AroM family protein [Deltaproteobacteria bacterium]